MEKFEDLKGKTLTNIENVGNKELVFTLDTGERYKLYHDQEGFESVTIEDINGDLSNLLGAPLLMVEEAVSDKINPPGVEAPEEQGSFIWTFYKLATVKGYVTVRWYGESNGCYSESVDFVKVD